MSGEGSKGAWLRIVAYPLHFPFRADGIIIDPDGVVQGFEVLTPPVGRNVLESIRQIQAFQHVRNIKGAEATPSGWKPGKLTLKPGPDLVGKVWEVWKTGMVFGPSGEPRA